LTCTKEEIDYRAGYNRSKKDYVLGISGSLTLDGFFYYLPAKIMIYHKKNNINSKENSKEKKENLHLTFSSNGNSSNINFIYNF